MQAGLDNMCEGGLERAHRLRRAPQATRFLWPGLNGSGMHASVRLGNIAMLCQHMVASRGSNGTRQTQLRRLRCLD